MRAVVRVWCAAVAAWMLLPVACGGSSIRCTCLVENNVERRTLVCGESACVGGILMSCAQDGTSVQRGACSGPEPSLPDASAPVTNPGPPLDHSCDDLGSFCSISCLGNPSASADCQATASAGDAAACAAWPLARGLLCQP